MFNCLMLFADVLPCLFWGRFAVSTFRFCPSLRTQFQPCRSPSPATTQPGQTNVIFIAIGCHFIAIGCHCIDCNLFQESTLSVKVARSRTRCCGCLQTYSAPIWELIGTKMKLYLTLPHRKHPFSETGRSKISASDFLC